MLACSVSLHSYSSLALRNRRDGLGAGQRFGRRLFVRLDGRLGFRATLDDCVRNFTRHEFDGTDCIVVAWNRIIDLVRVAIRVDDGDDRNLELTGFEDGDALFARIDDVERVWQTRHVFDAAEEPLEARELIFQLADFFFSQHFKEARITLALELAQSRNTLLNCLKICQGAAQPALVDVEHAGALCFLADNVLCLLFCADEQKYLAAARHVFDCVIDFTQLDHRLLQVDDVDAVALLENVAGHLRIPATGLVPEMDSRFEELLHRDDRGWSCHVRTFQPHVADDFMSTGRGITRAWCVCLMTHRWRKLPPPPAPNCPKLALEPLYHGPSRARNRLRAAPV